MEKLNKNNVALACGAFMGGFHALWAVAVASGSAQAILDWIYSIHFLNDPFVVDVFDLNRAIILVVFTFVVGALGGWLFAFVWNNVCGKKHKR